MKEKSPIDILLDKFVDYVPIDNSDIDTTNGLPYATHEGIMKIGDFEIKVVVLNDGRRIIEESEMEKFWNYLTNESSPQH